MPVAALVRGHAQFAAGSFPGRAQACTQMLKSARLVPPTSQSIMALFRPPRRGALDVSTVGSSCAAQAQPPAMAACSDTGWLQTCHWRGGELQGCGLGEPSRICYTYAALALRDGEPVGG